MNDRAMWINRINRDSKGIWGIVKPSGTKFDSNLIIDGATAQCEIRVVEVVCVGEDRRFFEHGVDLNSDFSQLLNSFVFEAQNNLRTSFCLVVEGFHNVDCVQQCDMVKVSRAVQESLTLINCKVVLVGEWNYFSFRAKYREIHGLTSSPAAESKNILRLPPWASSDVRQLLLQERIVGVEYSDFEKVAIDFLIEQTAGDEFLLRRIVKDLVEQQGDWKVNLEHVLYESVSSIAITSEIHRRLTVLSENAFIELRKILHAHRVIREFESVEIEELWLAGLVTRSKIDGKKNYVFAAGPIINTVVRNILQDNKFKTIANSTYLCFDRHAISAAAYRSVAVVENILRNMIVSVWYAELGDKWENNLSTTKTSSRARDDEEYLVKLTLNIVKSELTSFGIVNKDESPVAKESSSGSRQVTVLDSALDWKRRQVEHHGVDLDSVSIMHFLTTESLEAVLCNRKNGLYGPNKPFKKEPLMAILEEYRTIRSAIAHNQPVKLNTILRLEDIIRKIVEWNTIFVDQITMDANGRMI